MERPHRIDTEAVESIGHVIGMAAVIVGIAGLALSIGLAEDFSLQADNLSDLGDPATDLDWLFNGTIILAGVLSTVFFLTLTGRLPKGSQRLGVGIFAVSGAMLTGIGIFPAGHPLHLPLAGGFFVGVTVGLVAVGYGDRQAGRERRSKISWNLALLHVVAWSFAYVALEGVALPELVGVACFAIWILIVVIQRGRILPNARL